MKADVRAALTDELSDLSVEIAADLRETILRDPATRARAQRLHEAERVGEDFELWTDLLSRRAAVMWVLRSVYLRVLEDRGLLRTPRLVDPDAETLFRRLAPDLGATAFFRWVYRDLAMPAAGLAELFAPTPAEVAEPSNELSRRLLEFWREVDPDTSELRWRFDQEDFDSRLLGDLYQDLDPVVKQRYALLQTPDFVVDYILDETLEPAIAQWGVETVRLIDPACGSGHFLLAAFDRLFQGLREVRPELSAEEAAKDVLGRVVGIDLNDYACALARARLVMHALEASGSTDLADAADLHPLVFWADGLDQVEREAEEAATPEGKIAQLGFGEGYGVAPSVVVAEKPAAMLTPREVRDALRPVLAGGFHAVVANPPYITEKDKARKKYHKEKVGGEPRYVSAYMKYSLGCPFTERCFQLARDEDGGGFVGMITANSFMKRSFGRALIEQFFPTVTLTSVVDTSGAYIPGHGTPTVLLFGRSAKPSEDDLVWAVLGKRGEPSVPDVAAEGEVWTSIEAARGDADFENEFVSVAKLAQGRFHEHPWSLQGGHAPRLTQLLEQHASTLLEQYSESIGITCFTLEDDVFIADGAAHSTRSIPPTLQRPMVTGECVRDWAGGGYDFALFPYSSSLEPLDQLPDSLMRCMWPFRTRLASNRMFGGRTKVETGLNWFEYGRFTTSKLRTPLSIAFAEIATHNHFMLDRGGKVFNRTAPVIKLSADATVDDHLVLLGQLNSSTGEFWMCQVYFPKGGDAIGKGGRVPGEPWEERYQRDSTKLLGFPLATADSDRLLSSARAIDEVATARGADVLLASISAAAAQGPQHLRSVLDDRRFRDLDRLLRMTALQEELDWLCYVLYNVDPAIDLTDPAIAALTPDETPPLRPGQRPFEIRLARADAERRAAIERGDAPSQMPTEWFSRHGWAPVTDNAGIEDDAYRARVEARLAAIEQSKALQLLEQPTYKRRWYRPDYEKEEREALDAWLVDRLEDWAKDEQQPWTLTEAAMALESDPAVRAVCEVRTGRPDFSLVAELERLVAQDHVPNNKHHVYKPKGLEKRRAWERTWELQHAEDRGEDVDVPVPPKYRAGEFRKSAYWRLRGKLDVPKERFIAFQEMPGATGERALYGWAGWTPMQRAKVLLELDEKAENAGVPIEQRYGLLYGVWFQLPWVAWESEAAAEEFRAVVQDLVGAAGVTEAMLAEWAEGAD